MSRDSSPTYIHMHHSCHADLFEEFCRPPSSSTSTNTNANNANNPSNTREPRDHNSQPNAINATSVTDPNSGMIQIPGSFLPYEEIYLPAHLMPVNPEDEDDVVPDMHAAFGIQQALGGVGAGGGPGGLGEGMNGLGHGGVRTEERWRDLGLEGLLEGNNGAGVLGGVGGGRLGELGSVGGFGAGGGTGNGSVGGVNGVTRARREGRRTGLLLMR